MPFLLLSDPVRRELAEQAILPYRSTGLRQADGRWLIPIDVDVRTALDARRAPGEDDDGVVLRVIRAATRARSN